MRRLLAAAAMMVFSGAWVAAGAVSIAYDYISGGAIMFVFAAAFFLAGLSLEVDD